MQLKHIAQAAVLALSLAGMPSHAAINPNQLGAAYDASHNVNFKLYSSRATRIELYLYSTATGSQEKARIVMTKGSGNIWSANVTASALSGYGITGTVYYGYRAWGPNWPYNAAWTKGSATGFISDVDSAGNRFNPNKLLSDPYALELSHDPTTPSMSDGTVYASGALYRNIDNGSVAPKGMVLAGDTQAIGTKPTRAFKDVIVYETHVRGLSMIDTCIAGSARGT